MAFSDELELRSILLHLVDELQNPIGLQEGLYVYVPTAYSSGIGSQVRMIANSMMQAITLGRTFVVDAATSPYVHPSLLPGPRLQFALPSALQVHARGRHGGAAA